MVRRCIVWFSKVQLKSAIAHNPWGFEGDELLSNKRARVQSTLLKTVSISLGAKESRIDASSEACRVPGLLTTEALSAPTSSCWTTATSSRRWRIHLTTDVFY